MAARLRAQIILIWSNIDIIYQVSTYKHSMCVVNGAWVRASDSLTAPQFEVTINVEYFAGGELVRTSYAVGGMETSIFRSMCKSVWGCVGDRERDIFAPQTFTFKKTSRQGSSYFENASA